MNDDPTNECICGEIKNAYAPYCSICLNEMEEELIEV